MKCLKLSTFYSNVTVPSAIHVYCRFTLSTSVLYCRPAKCPKCKCKCKCECKYLDGAEPYTPGVHRRTVASSEAVATRSPAGENWRSVTAPWWPRRRTVGASGDRFHTIRLLSTEPVAADKTRDKTCGWGMLPDCDSLQRGMNRDKKCASLLLGCCMPVVLTT